MNKLRIILIFLFLFIVIILLNSRYIETTSLTTKEIVINDNNINTSYDGLKIVHIGDLHYGKIKSKDYLNKIKKEINLINPDFIFFTGDLIDNKINDVDKNILIKFLKELKDNYGKYAVLGEKDYKDLLKVKEIYDSSNFILLENDYDIIYNELGDKIFLGGLSSANNNPNINKTLEYFTSGIDIQYKIILVHEPDYTDKILNANNTINLILSGHSHLGQIVLPLYGGVIKKDNALKYKKEHYLINNTNLYITSGLGTTDINFRFNNKPSINFYRINKI